MEKGKKEILTSIKNIFLVVIGTLLLALGTAVFIMPFDLVAGGVSSIAIILDKLIPLEFLTVERMITLLTWALFFMGLFILGKAFALKTLVSTIVYPIGISIFVKLVNPDILGGFFYLQGTEYSDVAILLAALFGGVFIGAGCALAFIGGGSTGGTDILAFIICKIFKRLKSSVVIFVTDAATVILGMFIIKNLVVSLLGIITAFIGAVVIDKMFLGESKAFIAQIISDRYEEINNLIINKLERTTTIVDVTGGYSGEVKKMVIISFTMREYTEIINIINKTDKDAFITVHRAHEINGEGWTR